MEFQGQRGDPHSAWSVGKYAKRSATIHLCSEDCQTAEGKAFTGTIVSSSTQAYAGVQTPNITVFDPPGDGPQELRNPIRTAMANVNQDGATVRIYNDAMGTSHETSTVTLGGAARDGVHAVAALTDFTKLALDTNYQATDAADGVFNPLTVREIDNNQAVAGGAAVQTVAGQGLAVADSDIKIIRTQSDTYMFLVQTSVFPTTICRA